MGRGYVQLDIEEMPSCPADHIFITALPTRIDARSRVSQLFRSPAWLAMEAVRRKQVYLLNQPGLFFGYDPLSTQAQLLELQRVLLR